MRRRGVPDLIPRPTVAAAAAPIPRAPFALSLATRPRLRYLRRLTAAGMRAWWNWQTRQI